MVAPRLRRPDEVPARPIRVCTRRRAACPTPWSFWGRCSSSRTSSSRSASALSDGALARYLNGAFGVLTALALGPLTRRHLGESPGPAAAALFFTLPITWSMIDARRLGHAGRALWIPSRSARSSTGRDRAVRHVRRADSWPASRGRARVMGLLVPALTGGALLVLLSAGRCPPARRRARRRFASSRCAATPLLRPERRRHRQPDLTRSASRCSAAVTGAPRRASISPTTTDSNQSTYADAPRTASLRGSRRGAFPVGPHHDPEIV